MTRLPAPVLGEFELLALLAVLKLQQTAYPLAVAAQIETATGRSASRPAVLITLQRLEDKGLLRSRFGDPTPARGGRAKRFFFPTTLGRRAVREALARIHALTQGLDALLEES
jgi:DNA-binding PadR family transcriptional regulator